jgi:probable phosphoglycerate mutase
MAIPLTDLGKRQAERLALQRVQEPSRTVVSRAECARVMAALTVSRFPIVHDEASPIHEFKYLTRVGAPRPT